MTVDYTVTFYQKPSGYCDCWRYTPDGGCIATHRYLSWYMCYPDNTATNDKSSFYQLKGKSSRKIRRFLFWTSVAVAAPNPFNFDSRERAKALLIVERDHTYGVLMMARGDKPNNQPSLYLYEATRKTPQGWTRKLVVTIVTVNRCVVPDWNTPKPVITKSYWFKRSSRCKHNLCLSQAT